MGGRTRQNVCPLEAPSPQTVNPTPGLTSTNPLAPTKQSSCRLVMKGSQQASIAATSCHRKSTATMHAHQTATTKGDTAQQISCCQGAAHLRTSPALLKSRTLQWPRHEATCTLACCNTQQAPPCVSPALTCSPSKTTVHVPQARDKGKAEPCNSFLTTTRGRNKHMGVQRACSGAHLGSRLCAHRHCCKAETRACPTGSRIWAAHTKRASQQHYSVQYHPTFPVICAALPHV
jgi:hypothetical protein